MTGPLLASKLRVPRPGGRLVARPELDGRLRRGARSALTLVSAPAGFGKTTLLAGRSGPGRPAWLSLDPRDNDPALFWTYLVAALRTASPAMDGVGAGALSLLAPPGAPTETVLTALVNDLHTVPDDVELVLDDYHVIDAPDVHAGMRFLLEHLPPRLHLVIACRADPPFPLARMRARGELVEIRAADLRFTPDEVATYLGEVAGLDLGAADVAALEERTEGWAAALQLAALSLTGREDVSGAVSRFAGTDRYVVDYLVEEVLERQPEPVRDLLLQTAVLDRLTGPLCDALTGRDDGTRALVALERANMFLVALDDRREWYRYHHLFADVLRARVHGEQPGRVPLLHRRASRWFEQHDLVEDAVRHALAASDVDRAARLMERALPALRRDRRDALLRGWVAALPDDVVRRSPALSVLAGWTRMVAGDLDAVAPRLDDAARALAAGPAPPAAGPADLRVLPATIAIHRAALAQARGNVAGTSEHALRALGLAGPDDHLERGGAAGFLGLAAWAAGDLTSAVPTFTQAVTSLHAAGNVVDGRSSTVVLADMWLAAGRPGRARRLYREALQASRDEPAPRGTGDLLVGLGEIDLDAGDLDGARRHLEAATALGERGPGTHNRHRWFVAAGRLAAAGGDPDGAVDLLDRAERLYVPGVLPEVRPVAAVRARVRIAQGRLADATDWAEDRRVSLAEDGGYLGEYDHLTLVRLVLARHRTGTDPAIDHVLPRLDRMHAAAERSGRGGSLVEIRMLQALALDARGDRPSARAALGRALSGAPEPDACTSLLLAEGSPMTELLRDAGRHGVAGDLVRRLPAVDAPDPGPPPAGPLTDRERQVLRLLAGELTGPQIARELYVSPNTLRTHTKHIFTKLDVTTRRAAVRRARERGLL